MNIYVNGDDANLYIKETHKFLHILYAFEHTCNVQLAMRTPTAKDSTIMHVDEHYSSSTCLSQSTSAWPLNVTNANLWVHAHTHTRMNIQDCIYTYALIYYSLIYMNSVV